MGDNLTPQEAVKLLNHTLVCRGGEGCWLGDSYYDWSVCFGSAELLHILLIDRNARLVGWEEGENPSQTLYGDMPNEGHTFVMLPNGTIVDWWARCLWDKKRPAIVSPRSPYRQAYGDFSVIHPVHNSTLDTFPPSPALLRKQLLLRKACRYAG